MIAAAEDFAQPGLEPMAFLVGTRSAGLNCRPIIWQNGSMWKIDHEFARSGSLALNPIPVKHNRPVHVRFMPDSYRRAGYGD
jgi:hypothetical protein